MGEIFVIVTVAITGLVVIFDKLHAPRFLGAYPDILINRDNLRIVKIVSKLK